MRSRLSRFIATLSVLLSGLPGCGPRMPSPNDYEPAVADAAVLERELESIRTSFTQPALAGALVRSDDEPLQAVVGTLVDGGSAPATLHHRFHIGSTTKSFTALLVAQLVDEGVLTFETTLAEAFPDVPMHADYRDVTVHELMLSRSGLIAWQRQDLEDPAHITMLSETIPAETDEPRAQRRLVAAYALQQPPRFPPGSQGEYSNVGWAVLGHLLEEVTDTPYELLLADRIFTPLGMDGARIGGWPATPEDPEQPWGHAVDADGLHPLPPDDEYVLEPWMNPSGGIHCTLGDYAIYAREMLRGLRGDGVLLDAASYRTLHTVQGSERISTFHLGARGRQRIDLGYGWGLVELDDVWISVADGSAGTFYARLILVPDLDVAFAGFTNAGNGEPSLSAAYRTTTGLPW